MVQRLEKKKKGKKKSPVVRRIYSHTQKLKMVKLHLEGSVPLSVVSKESGISYSVLARWCKKYNQFGEEGLKTVFGGGRKNQIHPSVKEKIIELKNEEPESGIRKISHALKRFFFMPGSPETVRQTLHTSGQLIPEKKPVKEHNVCKPRRFERSTPNQMWQSDITMFKLGGTQVYLIGYIDDYSRYIVGMGLYASQKATQVLEVYRQAVVEYGAPKEMLTDNGRQYASWRGSTQFQAQMKKDGVKHIRSQPHHPMTLGKIERFWETIFQDFLSKAAFESFEDARERIRLWVQFYNHRRPHQGIGGMTPADRYFEVATELKQTIERGVKENVLEMALRGKSEGAFYMVGRMRGESVVLMAEKGKLKLRVSGKEVTENTELIYNLPEKGDITGGGHGKDESSRQSIEIGDTRCDSEMQSSSVGLDGGEETVGDMQRSSNKVDDIQPLAEEGDGRDVACVGTESESGAGCSTVTETVNTPGERSSNDAGTCVGEGINETLETAAKNTDIREGSAANLTKDIYVERRERGESSSSCSGDMGCSQREDNSQGGSELLRDIEAMLLRMGTSSTSGNGGGTDGQNGRSSVESAPRPEEGGDEAETCAVGAGKPESPPDIDGKRSASAVYGGTLQTTTV
jgi:transposase InsO family protein